MTGENALRGTVARVDARQCEVLLDGEAGPARPAALRGRLFEEQGEDRSPLAVGDRVQLIFDGEELTIEQILPRRSSFARRASGAEVRRQLLAANLDQVVVVCSFGTPSFSSIAADRILVAASFHGLPAALVLNKADRAKPPQIEPVVATYRRAGYLVLLTSTRPPSGIAELCALLHGKLSLFYGLSGVGKSSLLNAVESGLGLKTQEVSQSLRSGRHTTAFACLYPLAGGGAVIDSPGVRSFRPYGLPPHELRLHFPELRQSGRSCRYPDCTHRQEPDCMVRAALDSGTLAESRYRSYLEILAELEQVYGGTGSRREPHVPPP